jgi:hypothetical protein
MRKHVHTKCKLAMDGPSEGSHSWGFPETFWHKSKLASNDIELITNMLVILNTAIRQKCTLCRYFASINATNLSSCTGHICHLTMQGSD